MKDRAFNYTDTEVCARLGVGEGRLEPLIASLLIARVPIILMVIKILTLKSPHLNLQPPPPPFKYLLLEGLAACGVMVAAGEGGPK